MTNCVIITWCNGHMKDHDYLALPYKLRVLARDMLPRAKRGAGLSSHPQCLTVWGVVKWRQNIKRSVAHLPQNKMEPVWSSARHLQPGLHIVTKCTCICMCPRR